MITGTVQNGVVVFQPGVHLPEGTEVRIEPVPPPVPIGDDRGENSLAFLLKFVGTTNDLPTDMARNHDHYLHGAPKQ